MGGPRRSAFFILQALCVLLTLLDSQNTVDTVAKDCAPWCPQHSKCISATTCRCNPGFTSATEEIITNRLQICEDINECGPPLTVSCGRFADCKNTEGSYYCMCSPGYVLGSGEEKFRNKSENSCHDVNECISEQNPCHKSTHCLNIVGSYKCHCRPGWKPILGSPNGPNNTICEDVNECSSGEHQCDNSTFCVNTLGSYKCSCLQGWVPKPGFQNKQKTTQCEEIFSTWTKPPGIKSQSLSRFFERVQILGRDLKSASAQDIIRKLIESLDELLEVPGDLESLTLHDQLRTATNLLSGLEHVLRTLAKTMLTAPFTYHSPADTELTLMIQKQGNENVTMGQTHARMMLKWSEAAGEGDSDSIMAGMLSSQNMKKLLAKASLKLDLKKKDELEKLHRSTVSKTQFKFLSAINSAFLSNTKTEKLDSPVTFAFSHLPEKPGPRQELICAFWKGDNDSGGYWATTGCWKLGSQNGSTTCQCSHLSSFAILMAHYDIEDLKLALITKVGLALSLVCLLLCILTFLLVRPIQGSRTTVHLHLCICLFVGSAIFLAGIENQGGQVGIRCRLVAGLLHYCFLAAFCWMSLEGVELYILVVRVFPGQGLSKPWLYLIGYGVPGLIVLISAAVNSQGYGRDLYCWLNPDHGFLWSFLGPVTFIILCNAVIFVITVWKLTQKFSEINPDMKKLKKARVLTITAVSQLFLLGCTWILGLFLFDPKSQVLAYAFTILTCLQGFFLFLLHCLLNKKVREEYRKWAGMVTRNKYSEFTTSTLGSSHNQTRVLRPSESGM